MPLQPAAGHQVDGRRIQTVCPGAAAPGNGGSTAPSQRLAEGPQPGRVQRQKFSCTRSNSRTLYITRAAADVCETSSSGVFILKRRPKKRLVAQNVQFERTDRGRLQRGIEVNSCHVGVQIEGRERQAVEDLR